MDDTVDIARADPSLVDAAAVATGLGVDPTTGLSAAEAAARLARDGPNELRAKPPVPVWRKILAQFQDPLVYLLLVAIVISLVAWIAEGAHGAPVDVIVIAVIVIANAALGFVQENRAENAVAALAVMTAANSTVLRDGVLATVPSSGLVRGDILVLSEGDSVGADARLLTATGLKVQEASLTGESDATLKDPATLDGAGAHRRSLRHGVQGHGRRPGGRPGRRDRDRHADRDGRHRGHARRDREPSTRRCRRRSPRSRGPSASS